MKAIKLLPNEESYRESDDGYQLVDTVDTIVEENGVKKIVPQDVSVGEPIYELMELEKKETILKMLNDVEENLSLINEAKNS